MRLAFTTLGCPDWDLDALCSRLPAAGLAGVDFRGYRGELDVTRLPEFTSGAAATRRRLDDAGLAVSGVSSSIRVCDPAKRAANLEEARRTIPVALALGAPYVRVFGEGPVAAAGRAAAAAAGRACVEEILALDGAARLGWLFETHDHWVRAADCRLLLDAIPSPAFGALWDMGLTGMDGAESPAAVWAAIGPRVRYTHVKDAVRDPGHPKAMKNGWRYVPPGEGALPLAECVRLLRRGGYDGWLVFEHEKRWQPELPDAEEVLPKFVRWARALLDAP